MDTTEIPADAFAALRALLLLIADPAAAVTRLAQIEAAQAACAEAETKLANNRAEFDAQMQDARAKLDARSEETAKRLVAVRQAEGAMSLREERIKALEESWRFVGEPEEVRSGFKSPERSALAKARSHYGLDAEAEAEPEPDPLALLERAVPDPHFAPPDGVTITRSPPAPRLTPAERRDRRHAHENPRSQS